MNGRYRCAPEHSEAADQPVACATSTHLFITSFCSVAFTFEWQPSWRLIFTEVGAGQEFVAEQLGRIEIVFGYVATAAAVAELRAGIGFMTEVPVFQTNFFPDFMHVKVLPDTTDVLPTLVHAPPALTAALTGIEKMDKQRESIATKILCLLIIPIT